MAKGKRVAIVLEGRDAAGKGRLSSGITHYLNPKFARIVAQGTPTRPGHAQLAGAPLQGDAR